MERDRLVFKVDDKIVIDEDTNLTLNQIDKIKIYISKEMGCFVDEIEVVLEKCPVPQELSNVDCTSFGLIFFDEFPDEIRGVRLNLILGSDEHLDAINNGTLEKYLIFFV